MTPARRSFRSHPVGLWVLAGTEFWDRVSFHGMQALLVLYMVGALLLPGHVERVAGFATFRATVEGVTGPLSITALAAQTFGLYVGLIYFTPVLGGWVGDRLTGRRVAVTAGALLMTGGHLCLAFDRTFLLALLLLIFGAGLLRGNLAAQVKALYADGDPREADAFQLYYVGINIGAFAAPVITGALAAAYGWHAGFAFAAAGMLVGLLAYLTGQRHLPPDPPRLAITARVPFKRPERQRLWGLALLWPAQLCFWVAQTQVWNLYNLWVRDRVNLRVGGFTVPVPWLQALDGIAPVLMMPLVLWWWRRQAARGREPDALVKLATGCLIFAGGTAWLACAPLVSAPDGRAPLLWAVAFHLLSNTGWLYFTPVVLALYAAKAPPSVRGTVLGLNYAAAFVGSVASGRAGVLYERWPAPDFWLLHAAVVGAGGVVVLLCLRPLRRLLAGDDDAPVC